MEFGKAVFIAGALAISLPFPNDVRAQALAIGSDGAGTTHNAIASGLAKVASQYSGVNIVVRPFAGPAAWMPLLNSGEIQLGAGSANSLYDAFNGKGSMKTPLKNMRILRAGGGVVMVGFIVPAKSDVTALRGLRGKRVASDFGGHVSVPFSVAGTLAMGGMTWKDVVPVPVSSINNGVDALVGGRLEATWVSLGQPQVREAHFKIGIRYLPLENTPEALAIARDKIFPGIKIAVATKGPVPGVEGDTPMLTYDTYLLAHEGLANERVRAVLQALWDHTDSLAKTHRALEGFNHANAVTESAVAPYHPAAVSFYKEKGVWTSRADKLQEELLAQAKPVKASR
jgi:TRAP transporter TAXI family solute receptor